MACYRFGCPFVIRVDRDQPANGLRMLLLNAMKDLLKSDTFQQVSYHYLISCMSPAIVQGTLEGWVIVAKEDCINH